MATSTQLKFLLFKSVLRNYFYNHPQVQSAFPMLSLDDYYDMQFRGWEIERAAAAKKDGDEYAERERERAFTLFYRRLTESNCFIDEKGKFYDPNNMEKLLDDFMSGKPISFPGTGNDGMVSISADPDDLSRYMVNANRVRAEKNHKMIPEVFHSYNGDDEKNMLSEKVTVKKWKITDIKSQKGDVSPNRPKSNFFQTLLNKIKKKIFGSPTDLWAPYERYCERQVIETAVSAAQRYKSQSDHDELCESNIKSIKKNAIDDKKTDAAEVEFDPEIADKKSKLAAEKSKFAECVNRMIDIKRKDGTLPKHDYESCGFADFNAAEAEKEDGTTLIDGNSIDAGQPAAEGVSLQTENVVESGLLAGNDGITEEQTENGIEASQPAEADAVPVTKEGGAAENTGNPEKNQYASDPLTWEERKNKMLPCETGIASYKRAFFGTDNSGYEVDKYHITNEKFLMDSKVGSKVDDMFLSIDALKGYGQYGIPEKELKDLPEHLANVYLLGKIKEAYPRREIYLDGLDEVDFNDLAEYNQIIMRFDEMKAAAANMFRKSNLTESIINDPTGKISTIVLNKDAVFSNLIDSSMKKAGVFDEFEKKAMGENYVPKTSKAKETKMYPQSYDISFNK